MVIDSKMPGEFEEPHVKHMEDAVERTRKERAMADDHLWGVNIHGPDDLIAVKSYDEAVYIAHEVNKWWIARIKANGPGGISKRNPPLFWAVPCQWPHTEGHAEDLANPSRDYADFIEAVRCKMAVEEHD